MVVLSHLTLFFLFGEAFMSLVLWRGQSEMTIPMPSYSTPKFFKWIDLQFPLHSLVVFVCLINLVENYDLLPSLFFAAVGWYVLKSFIHEYFSRSHFLYFTFLQVIVIHIEDASGQSKPLAAPQRFSISFNVVDHGRQHYGTAPC
jgi:hypothetical protein